MPEVKSYDGKIYFSGADSIQMQASVDPGGNDWFYTRITLSKDSPDVNLTDFYTEVELGFDYSTLSSAGVMRDAYARLIDADGTQLGIMATKDALRIAQEKELDLINIAPQAKPPVCKILDYGKYRFEQAKREKEAKKKQKVIEVKEVRLSPNIEDHDMETKARMAVKFLQGGDKVKVSVRFRGRELTRTEVGKVVLDQFVKSIADYAEVEKTPKMEGRSMVMFLMPKR